MNKQLLHIPVEFYKGKSASGKEVMKMRGVASTPSKDSDKEYLDPSGFDTDYFLKNGFMNWNHQAKDDPSALVGRPTSAKVTKKNELVIDYTLFSKSKKAKEVYQLAEIMADEGLSLGLSIEGTVVERDPLNPMKVTKAKITGCAITPNPKNADTVTQIVKGHNLNSLSAYSKSEVADEEDEEDTNKKEKSLSAGSSSGRAISKESLDSKLKKTTFTKSEVFSKLFSDNPQLDIVSSKRIFGLIESIEKSNKNEMKNENTEISQESIDQAYVTLGLKKGETAEVVETTTEVIETADQISADETTEAATATDEASTEEVVEAENLDNELQKAIDAVEVLQAKIANRSEVKVEGVTPSVPKAAEVIEKSVTAEVIEKPVEEVPVLEKGAQMMVDLIKSENAKLINQVDDKFEMLGEMTKGNSDQLGELSERMNVIETTPLQRKSATTSNYIKKSFEGGETPNERKVVLNRNNPAHKVQILNLMDDISNISKGEDVDMDLAKSMGTYESSGVLKQDSINKIIKARPNLVIQ